MWCQCNYKSNIRTDCIHYHCEHDMGASIDCCTLKEGLGNCPCTKDCPDYADKAEVYRLGLEALKHPENHRNECVYGDQPGALRINLNEPIKVKLTDWGKEIYYHQYDRTNQIAGREICKPSFPKEDENGYTEFQLWRFIELYGMHMGITMPNVIEPLEIVYEK